MMGCIQKQRSFCCFDDKIGRIFHEQGRKQLVKSDISWEYDPEFNMCRGFLPEEFASVDFQELDLSEFELEIELKANEAIAEEMKGRIHDWYTTGGTLNGDI
jgi:conjugal transfer mating pair stabilization protein TraN